MTDEELLALLICDREAGMAEIAVKYEKLFVHIMLGILGGRHQDIEECLNDTYLKIWKSVGEFDISKASLKTYLKVIARNTALTRLRDISRREEKEIPDDLSEIAKDYVDHSRNVEAQILKQEDYDRLSCIIRGLDSKDRELVIRRYFYLQPTKEIAGAMGMKESAVDTRLSRLRVRMKREYEKE
ncbi:MAG: sigma-70 family RNA polymerase sigma factor [Lachnospiraceae bacterium]|nr:sigma-70 family RNA polymerase sigma factor [Lachnospiraceae bacterium]